jgi:hypothetical protein
MSQHCACSCFSQRVADLDRWGVGGVTFAVTSSAPIAFLGPTISFGPDCPVPLAQPTGGILLGPCGMSPSTERPSRRRAGRWGWKPDAGGRAGWWSYSRSSSRGVSSAPWWQGCGSRAAAGWCARWCPLPADVWQTRGEGSERESVIGLARRLRRRARRQARARASTGPRRPR